MEIYNMGYMTQQFKISKPPKPYMTISPYLPSLDLLLPQSTLNSRNSLDLVAIYTSKAKHK